MNTRNLIRWAGLSAVVAGLCFVVVGLFHPPNILSSVSTSQWVIVHAVAIAMSVFGLFGITGLYARQAHAAGWLGLAGYLLFSLWLVLILAFTFFEAFILPLLATEAPKFVEGFLGIASRHPSAMNLGALPALFALLGLGYVLGGLLFGIATFRAGILPRWAAGLLAVGAVAPIVLMQLPHPLDRTLAVPMGIALAWLGYALWSERREQASESVPGTGSPQLLQTTAE
jgi:hypothetical protein